MKKVLVTAELSKEELTQKRDEMYNALVALCQKHEADFKKRTLTSEEREDLTNDIEKQLKKLNEVNECLVYLGLKNRKNPVLEASKLGEFSGYGLKKNREPGSKDSSKFFYSVKSQTRKVAIFSASTYFGKIEWLDTCHAFQWYIRSIKSDLLEIESLACTLTGKSKEVMEKFLDAEMAYELNPDNAKNPRGMGAQKDALNELVSAALGDKYHCKKCDVQIVNDLFFKDGRSVKSVKEEDFEKIIGKVLHRIATNGMYENESIKKK